MSEVFYTLLGALIVTIPSFVFRRAKEPRDATVFPDRQRLEEGTYEVGDRDVLVKAGALQIHVWKPSPTRQKIKVVRVPSQKTMLEVEVDSEGGS